MKQNIYDFNAVKESISCERYLKDRGIPIRSGNRFNAVWRGGDSFSCSFDGYKYFDHKDNLGGSVIDLCIKVENLSSPLIAVKVLGDRFRLEPVAEAREAKKLTRGEMLVKDGFTLAVSYAYEDESGTPRYFVDRYEKITDGHKEKQFVQRTTTKESLEGVERLLYNLPAVMKSPLVYIVEGEKDVETMRRLGLVATTNSGGAKYWNADFNRYFAAKDVVILPDNDETGREHGEILYSMLLPIAKSCRIAVVSALPKGDVTDFLEKEGGDIGKLNDIVKNAVQPDADGVMSPEVAAAKAANAESFKNYFELRDGKKTKRMPRPIGALVDEVHTRFLGFPKVLGSVMFDWNKDDKKIVNLYNKDDLFSWMQGCSKNIVEWESGIGFVTKPELYSRIMQTSIHYSGASMAPFFPHRADIFPMYEKLPNSDPTHSRFWELVSFFNPASEAYRTLIAAFLCAPMFYDGKNPRPAWLIDTDDAQGSGKTSVVTMCARLYNEDPIDVDLAAMERDVGQIKKRLVSSEGRQKRIVLFDNLTKTFKSGNLAGLVTAPTISERAAYGRGEESRPNDLTFCATMNGATLDTDMATRCYTIRIKAVSNPDPMWLSRVQDFIDIHRKQIYADIFDMLTHAKERKRSGSRFGIFDRTVLSAVCRDDAEFAAVDEAIRKEAAAANEDSELAEQFEEAVNNALVKFSSGGADGTGFDESLPCYLRFCDLENILAHTDGQLKHYKKHHIRLLAKGGKLENWSTSPERFPAGFEGVPRARGIFYGKNRMDTDLDGTTRVQVVQFNDLRVPHVIATVRIKRDLVG